MLDTAPCARTPVACSPCGAAARLCKKWARCGVCTHNGCPFRHSPTPSEERRVERARAQSEAAKRAGRADDDPFDEGDKAAHGARHRAFARFLIDTFGTDHLRSGCGVLDVGGGRAGLSFELHCCQRIACTLIEPRSVLLKSNQRRHVAKMSRQPSGQTGHPPVFTHVRALLDEAFEASPQGAALLADCSMLVGMHCDEATEPLVRAAIRHGKPFAVAPCCVFPRLFAHRRLRSGGRVLTYDAFCTWLCELCPGSEVAYLPFQGRNRVIFRRPAPIQAHALQPALRAIPPVAASARAPPWSPSESHPACRTCAAVHVSVVSTTLCTTQGGVAAGVELCIQFD